MHVILKIPSQYEHPPLNGAWDPSLNVDDQNEANLEGTWGLGNKERVQMAYTSDSLAIEMTKRIAIMSTEKDVAIHKAVGEDW